MIFITETGLQSANDTSAAAIAALANDARASLHTIPAAGLLDTDPDYGLHATLQQAVATQSLRTMADLTGGLPAITEKGQAALDRLDETTRSGYLLGFQSSRAAWDGSYRQLVVRVNRPNTTVLYRHGYYRLSANGYFDRREIITSDRLSAGGNFRREVADIRLKASISAASGHEPGRRGEDRPDQGEDGVGRRDAQGPAQRGDLLPRWRVQSDGHL